MAQARPTSRRVASGLLAALFASSACNGVIGTLPPDPPGADGGTLPPGADAAPDRHPDDPPPPPPFEALGPAAYGTKVKNLLVGQPLTDAELTQLTANPASLPSLIDTWMAQPAWRERMITFFKQAFQQTQVNTVDYEPALHFDPTRVRGVPFLANMEEMFPRTVLALMDEGRPFTEAVTTRRFMLTPALMSMLAFHDATPEDDEERRITANWWLLQRFPMLTVTGVTTAVPVAQSIDPASPNFMRFQVASGSRFTSATGANAVTAAMAFILGANNVQPAGPALTPEDWTNWRMIEVRQPRSATEQRTIFWNLPQLRTARELVLGTPRVGFMTTPAFQANWPSNISNQHRVTINQAMIVALGLSFDDRGSTIPIQSDSSDAMHAEPGTVCWACHVTLDPMRDFFRQSYTYSYSPRANPTRDMIPAQGTFTVEGSAPIMGTGVGALADAITTHPRFATAWTQKLCRFANSVSCDETDPEFQRVAAVFRDSNFNFRRLMRELFSSPLVTYASRTLSAERNGVGMSVARRDNLCFSLSNRFGMPDVCGIYGRADARARNLAMSVPGDGYARGAEAPLLPTDPDLFFQSATENLCNLLATRLVDAGATSRYTNTRRDAAMDDFVATVIGLPPSDPRSPRLRAVLARHYTEATAMGRTPTEALRSTFILACSSPIAVSSGL